MPLAKGSSKEVVSSNIREMKNAGHSEAQSVAASLKSADKSAKRKGKLKALEVRPAENGGYIVNHRYEQPDKGPYQDSVDHAFGNHADMMAHVHSHTK